MSCFAVLYWSLSWARVASSFALLAAILKTSLILIVLITSKSNLVPCSTSLTFFVKVKPDKIWLALCFILLSKISSSTILSCWTVSISALSIVIDLSSFSIPCLLKTLTSTTVPLLPLDILKDVSVTSIAFSPKIDLNNFSSGPEAESPFGVTFPTKISPAFTSAPIYTIPDSSRFFSASSLTFGMSLVISSSPSLVSLAMTSYSTICTDVNTSSVTHLSEIKIESSKL